MRILLIEDEEAISSFIIKGFSENGDEVVHAANGMDGLKLGLSQDFEVIILDVILPQIDGRKVCESLRAREITTPILMLSALSETEDIVTGLDLGADDYLAKPFKFAELNARVKALLRRKKGTQVAVLRLADLALYPETKTVLRAGQPIKLTAKEFKLLHYFMQYSGKVITRATLLEKVWDIDFDTGTNIVDVYVKYLRNKIDKDHPNKLLHTLIGMGYVLKEIKE